MKKENQNVWIGIEDKTGDAKFLESGKQEFFELPLAESLSNEKALDLPASRRDFLKYLGFGLGAATVAAGCDIPIKRAIPYVIKPDEIARIGAGACLERCLQFRCGMNVLHMHDSLFRSLATLLVILARIMTQRVSN